MTTEHNLVWSWMYVKEISQYTVHLSAVEVLRNRALQIDI